MISSPEVEWLNAIVRRHKQTKKIRKTLPTAAKKPPVTGGDGKADSPSQADGNA